MARLADIIGATIWHLARRKHMHCLAENTDPPPPH
jgi:hypothetical protein